MSFVVFVHVCWSLMSSWLFGYKFYEISFHNLALQFTVDVSVLYTVTGS